MNLPDALAHASPTAYLFLATLPAAIVFERWRTARARQLVEEWARENRFRLTECRRSWFGRGPYQWRSSDYQIVFRVSAVDLRFGSPCRGWARCGLRSGPLTPGSVDVQWTYIGEMDSRSA